MWRLRFPGTQVIVKRITVHAASDEDLSEVMPYEAQQHIPFDISDVNLSSQPLGDSPSGEELTSCWWRQNARRFSTTRMW